MPPVMEETPPIPPAVAGSMGGGAEKPPFSGMGAMLDKKPAGPGGPGVQPTGALSSAADAVKKVVDNMATMDKEGGPWAARIKQMLDAWTAEAAKRGGPAAGKMSPLPAPATAGGGGPTEGHGFVG